MEKLVGEANMWSWGMNVKISNYPGIWQSSNMWYTMILLRKEVFPRKWLSTQQLWHHGALLVSICSILSRDLYVCKMHVLEGICEIRAGFTLLVIAHLFAFSVDHVCCAELPSRVRLCTTPWAVAWQAPLSMGFSRRDSPTHPRRELTYPSRRNVPNPGIEPRCPALQMDSSPSEPREKSMGTRIGSLCVLWGNFQTQDRSGGSCITGRFKRMKNWKGV